MVLFRIRIAETSHISESRPQGILGICQSEETFHRPDQAGNPSTIVYGTMLAASFRRVISWIRSTGRIWKRSVRSTNSRSTCSITIRTRSRIGSSVSVSRMCGRPVVHGKVIKPTESGAKLHLSIDEWGLCKN